jgi:hypothetical protein
MPTPTNWQCPGCGRTVVLSAGDGTSAVQGDAKRRDLLARALCGCWVRELSEGGVARLLRAVVTGDGFDSGLRDSGSTPQWPVTGKPAKAVARQAEATAHSVPRLRYSTP